MIESDQMRSASQSGFLWLVDDSALQAELGRRALADRYDIRVFHDGATMLEALGEGDQPDLLLLDWHMPGLTGLDLCRFVRETRDALNLPILILTSTGVDDLAEALAAGANDFVRKPFARIELEARVGALVRSKQIHARLCETEGRLRVEGVFRERFLGMLAHDLRQPLNTFILANQTLAAAASTSPTTASLLSMQRRAADRMTRMIADLLDFTRSRPEAGMPIHRLLTDLGAVASGVIEEMRVGHPTRTFRLNVQGACEGWWDRDRLVQIFTNLLGNAIEHSTSTGSPIDVGIVRYPAHVELAVSNQGSPIPAKVLPVLFEPFRRGTDANRTTGLGLGLHIVNEIARAHGGSVSAQSDTNATIFRVNLPIEAVPASSAPAALDNQ
jgi:sigma-B regulation protein RsbU (phosphoserine phosphatase)